MNSTEPRIDAYLRGGYKTVEGWLFPGAIALLSRVEAIQGELGLKGSVGEIGIHHGKLFILLYLFCRGGERAVAVDLFEQQEKNLDGSGLGDEERFRRNLAIHAGDEERLTLISGDSTELTPADLLAAGGPFRLFSVDGGHTAQITESDLALVSRVLVPGGILVLDDYFNEEWPGVSEGTNRFFANRNANGSPLIPFAIGGNKLLFTTDRAHADSYVEHLFGTGPSAALGSRLGWYRKMTSLFGCDVVSYRFFVKGIRQRLASLPGWSKLRDTPIGEKIRRVADRLS
jgi:SAM-dependent methyltransferase